MRQVDQAAAAQVLQTLSDETQRNLYWWLCNYGPQPMATILQYFDPSTGALNALVTQGAVRDLGGGNYDVSESPASPQPQQTNGATQPPAASGKPIARPPRPKLKKILPELESLITHMEKHTAALPQPYQPSKEMQQLVNWMRQEVQKVSKPRKKD